MPFVSLTQIKPYIEKSMYNLLSSASSEGGDDYFDLIEPAAAIIIRDRTGREIPSAVSSAPDWIVPPAAWIIQKLAKNLLTEITPEYNQRIEEDFERALKILDEHPVEAQEPLDRSTSYTGSINGVASW